MMPHKVSSLPSTVNVPMPLLSTKMVLPNVFHVMVILLSWMEKLAHATMATSNQKQANVFSVMKTLQLSMAKSVNVSMIFIFFNPQLVSVFHAVVQKAHLVWTVTKNVFVLMVSSSARTVYVYPVTLNTVNSTPMENVNVKNLNLESFQKKPTFV